MAKAPKKSAVASHSLSVYEPNLECASTDFSLGLKPAELEALLERLCSCGILRAKHDDRTRSGVRCALRVRTQWCQMGERGPRGERVETRFG